jgi:ribosome-binding protein aMBF1 (putative translation factor)
MVGLKKSAICSIERGRSKGRVDTWDKLSAVLKVKADKLRQIANQ